MSYRRSWSRTLEPAEMTFDIASVSAGASPCTIHKNCFRAERGGWPGLGIRGTWRMKTPINISEVMPGSNKKILTARALAMRIGSQGWGGLFAAAISLIADSARVFYNVLDFAQDTWRDNLYKDLGIDINEVLNLDIQLYQECSRAFPSSYLDMHVANMTVDGEYYTEVPPNRADVTITVRNKLTSNLLKDAYVAIMSGNRVVADGYTDGSGSIIFLQIDEGSYVLKVLGGGYYDFDVSIEVEPPAVRYDVLLVPIPVAPTPAWVWWAVGGVAALGAVAVVPSIIRRREKELVVVR